MTLELVFTLMVSCVITAIIGVIRRDFDEAMVCIGFVFVGIFYIWLQLL